MAVTINERAADLRRVIDDYDAGNPPVNKAGALLPGAKAEIVAVDPVIEAAEALLEVIGAPAPAAAVDNPDSASHFYCPVRVEANGGQPGDNLTHSFVSRAAGLTCTYCGKTDAAIRKEVGL